MSTSVSADQVLAVHLARVMAAMATLQEMAADPGHLNSDSAAMKKAREELDRAIRDHCIAKEVILRAVGWIAAGWGQEEATR